MIKKGKRIDKKEDKKETRQDLGHLKVKSAMQKNKEVGRHRRSIHKQGEHLENHGVKHPITTAKHEVHAEKQAKKIKIKLITLRVKRNIL